MNLSSTTKSILIGIPVFSALGAVIGAFIVPSAFVFNFLGGVAIGAVVSALKVLLLERAVNKAVEMDAQKASIYMTAGYLPRYALTGLGIFASWFFLGLFGIIGAVVGAMALTISAYTSRLFEARIEARMGKREGSAAENTEGKEER